LSFQLLSLREQNKIERKIERRNENENEKKIESYKNLESSTTICSGSHGKKFAIHSFCRNIILEKRLDVDGVGKLHF
jgi:hypothetical protein